VQVIIPEDSMLAVRAPRPVGGYTETILRIIDVIFGALAKAAPTRVNGMAYGTINALSLAGYRSDSKRRGQRWVMFSFFGGGHGGHPLGDGLNHGNAPISTATIPPCEILEAAYPVIFTQWALRPDSGGDGMHRGGLGAIYEIELLENAAEAFIFAERGKFAPAGVAGGKPAAKNVFRWRSRLVSSHAGDAKAGKGGKAGVWHVPPGISKMVGIKLQRGDRVRIESPGGGGYGLPSRRSAAARAQDLRLGYVTAAPRRRASKRKPI
jgi:N-methylhydantoinase B